jgi:hypothetical protein
MTDSKFGQSLGLHVWVCPKCGSIEPCGWQTVFGPYTAADAALNHIETKHPEVEL